MSTPPTNNTPTNILTIKTNQINLFKTLITACKYTLGETNITFTKQGMRITQLDSTQTILTDVKLPADRFTDYDCCENKITICVDMSLLYNLIKSTNNDDTLTIYIESSDYPNNIVSHLSLKIENPITAHCNILKLCLNKVYYEDDIRELEYFNVITLPSDNFKKIITDLSYISDQVTIQIDNKNEKLIYQCDGDFVSSTIECEKSDYLKLKNSNSNSSQLVSGTFNLDKLNLLYEFVKLSADIELCLEQDYPLCLKYRCDLGEINLYFAPNSNDE